MPRRVVLEFVPDIKIDTMDPRAAGRAIVEALFRVGSADPCPSCGRPMMPAAKKD